MLSRNILLSCGPMHSITPLCRPSIRYSKHKLFPMALASRLRQNEKVYVWLDLVVRLEEKGRVERVERVVRKAETLATAIDKPDAFATHHPDIEPACPSTSASCIGSALALRWRRSRPVLLDRKGRRSGLGCATSCFGTVIRVGSHSSGLQKHGRLRPKRNTRWAQRA